MCGSEEDTPVVMDRQKLLNSLREDMQQIHAELSRPPDRVSIAYNRIQRNRKLRELFLDTLEKMILVGGLTYFAVAAHDTPLILLSYIAVSILFYHTATRLLEDLYIPIGKELSNAFSWGKKAEIIMIGIVTILGSVVWIWLFNHFQTLMLRDHF